MRSEKMQDIVIKTINLTKKYGKKLAVNGLNMQVQKGAIYGLLGRNGSGKTTTLSMLSSLIYPSSGEIDLFGSKKTELGKMKMGASLQNSTLYTDSTALENLIFYAKLKKVDEPKKHAIELIKKVGLEEYADKKVKTFSHGMRQLLAIAYALIGKPDLILLDEPTDGLDPEYKKKIKDLVKSLKATLIISSHDLSFVDEVCTDVGIIDAGKMKIEGELKELKGHKTLEDLFLESIEQ